MTVADTIRTIAAEARGASYATAKLSSAEKNALLLAMAGALEERAGHLLAENAKDLEAAGKKGISPAMLDRLMLNRERIMAMADGLREVAALPDPVGEVTRLWKRPTA